MCGDRRGAPCPAYRREKHEELVHPRRVGVYHKSHNRFARSAPSFRPRARAPFQAHVCARAPPEKMVLCVCRNSEGGRDKKQQQRKKAQKKLPEPGQVEREDTPVAADRVSQNETTVVLRPESPGLQSLPPPPPPPPPPSHRPARMENKYEEPEPLGSGEEETKPQSEGAWTAVSTKRGHHHHLQQQQQQQQQQHQQQHKKPRSSSGSPPGAAAAPDTSPRVETLGRACVSNELVPRTQSQLGPLLFSQGQPHMTPRANAGQNAVMLKRYVDAGARTRRRPLAFDANGRLLYSEEMCGALESCKWIQDGDLSTCACPRSHRSERLYHPRNFKTKPCSGLHSHCKRTAEACDYAHGARDTRYRRPQVYLDARSSHVDADFYVYAYMTKPCSCTEPLTCCSAGYHSRLDARRPPLHGEYHYDTKPCDYVCVDGVWLSPDLCPEGDACRSAHTAHERCYHPASYKHALCMRETCLLGAACSLAHGKHEVRKVVPWCLPASSAARVPAADSDSSASTRGAEKSDRRRDRPQRSDGGVKHSAVSASPVEDRLNGCDAAETVASPPPPPPPPAPLGLMAFSLFSDLPGSLSSAAGLWRSVGENSRAPSWESPPDSRRDLAVSAPAAAETKQLPVAVKKCGECDERYAVHVCLHCGHILCSVCSDRLHPVSRLQAPHTRFVCASSPAQSS